MESESTQSRLAAFSEAWLAPHPKGKTKELARAWRLEQLRRTRASIPTVIGRGGATLGALPADVYGLIAAQDEGALRALRSASRRTRTSTAPLVEKTYCDDVTPKELVAYIRGRLASGDDEAFTIGTYPLDARDEINRPRDEHGRPQTVYLSADGYEVVRHGVVDRRGAAARRSGITSLLMLGSKLSAVVGPTDHVTLSGVIDVAGPQGTAEVLRALFVSYTGQARRFEPIFSLRLLKSLLEAKVPCVNEDRAKGLDFVRRRLEAIVRSQAERLLGRLGTTLEKVLGGEGDELVGLNVVRSLRGRRWPATRSSSCTGASRRSSVRSTSATSSYVRTADACRVAAVRRPGESRGPQGLLH